ncbi:MAG TPA: hypothetical protein DHW45_21340 [Candidatus Latescibacteria bacterium]|nr:hypothetical protein [Candidatus Latescibacterota bacterium]
MSICPSTEFSLEAFPLGLKGWHHIQFASPLRIPVTLPIAVSKSASGGPTIVVTGLVHGDEFEGPSAISRLFFDLQLHAGTFIGLPLTNPWAHAGQSRNTPKHFDGLNLARQFPGLAEGSRTQQLAHLLYQWVTGLLGPNDLLIDLHSAGSRYEYLSMVGYHPTDDDTESASRELAAAFGFRNLWQIPDSPSSRRTLNGSIARAGIPTIGTEVRGFGGLRSLDVDLLVNGIRRVLAVKGMVADEPPTTEDVPIQTTHQIVFSTSGLFNADVDLADTVQAGQPLGRVLTIQGETVETLIAPVDGQVWAIRRFASVHPSDIAFLIAQPI